MSADVVVVGGGPAGLAVAIASALKKLKVLVVDSRKPPIDKACGEGLLPEAVAALDALGIHLDSNVAFPLAGISFSDRNSCATASIPRGAAFGLRRTVLHQLLIDRATQLAVQFAWGSRISRFAHDAVIVGDASVSYRWLIGADGRNSAVRNWARFGASRHSSSRFGFRRHYRIAPWNDLVEVHWGEQCQMIVTPVGPEEICIGFLTSDPRLRIDRALSQFPSVAAHLKNARPTSSEAGAVTVLGRSFHVTSGNIALVGDASCVIDGIAGQGLCLAFREAIQLGNALATGNLAQYEVAHRRITKTAVNMTRLMLFLNRNIWIRRKTIRLFAARPALFAKMMSVHTGAITPREIHAQEIINFGWRFLWA